MTHSHDHGEHRGPSTGDVDELLSRLGSDDPIARQKARHALVAIGQPAVAPLAAALGDRRTQVRWEASKALVRIADATAAPALTAVLEDQDAGVRWLAAEALITVGPAGLPALLQALAQRDSSLWLFEGAHHVLHALHHTDLKDVIEPVSTALEHTARDETVPVAATNALQQLAGRL